jgi:proteasome-associated ATPase
MSDSTEQLIEREVQRRLARQLRPLNDEIADLRRLVQTCQNDLVRQHNDLTRLTSQPLTFGNLLKVHNFVDPSRFKEGDEIMVVDPSSPHHYKGGHVIGNAEGGRTVSEDGYCRVTLMDGTESRFAVGVEGGELAQIRLTEKKDGTYAVVNLDGKPWEVHGVPDLSLRVGDPVKVMPDNKAIVCKGYDLGAGPICSVVAVLDDCVEVMHKGDKHLVYNPHDISLEEGDRVACDATMFCVMKKLPHDARNRYKVADNLSVTWDDIGGLESAKEELRDALELPFQHPDLYKFYAIEPIRGILLYGPPGCGKTLLARVAAWAMANLHGKSAVDSAYIYVKSPEILDKWVGNTEKEIRDLFERGRRHYREHGYKAILAFDEADAIMPQRGTRRSSDVSDTIVPMFLGEMDGIDSKQTEENPIVMLLTNRADVLDPAVTRPGRISSHIKIDRPDEMGSIEVLKVHTRKIPLQDDRNRMAILAITAADLFSKSRVLYRVNNEYDFTLGDCVNGAMLENIAQIAKMNALHRDLAAKSRTGVTTEDFRQAVQKVFRQQRGVNHTFDLHDFAEKHGIQPNNIQVERRFGSA